MDSVTTLVHAFVSSRVHYCNILLASSLEVITDKLQRVLNAAARVVSSGDGTNLKVGGGTGPARKFGGTGPAQSAPEIFFVVPLHFFGSKSTIRLVVLVNAFMMVSLVYCSSTQGAPCAQPFVKVGGHVPPCPMESAPLVVSRTHKYDRGLSRLLHPEPHRRDVPVRVLYM